MGDSIIVYRNPVEQMFWESNIIPWVACFVLLMVAVIWSMDWLANRLGFHKFTNPRWFVVVSLVITGLIMYGVTAI